MDQSPESEKPREPSCGTKFLFHKILLSFATERIQQDLGKSCDGSHIYESSTTLVFCQAIVRTVAQRLSGYGPLNHEINFFGCVNGFQLFLGMCLCIDPKNFIRECLPDAPDVPEIKHNSFKSSKPEKKTPSF